MLEAILSGARQPIACDDYVLVRAWDGQDTIELRLHRRDPAAQVLGERTRVYETTGGQTYYVSGVDGGQTYVDYVLKKDLSDWEKTAYPGYTNGSKDATAVSTITGVLPEGWTLVEKESDDLSAYLTLQGPTPLEVALQCMDTYGCALEFDNQKKVVYLHYPGKKTLGQAFLVETANLRQAPEYKSKAGSLVTRLYAQGADGIDFAAVNGGKSYVECFDYTDELVAGYWRDDRYTVPEHLLSAAQEKIKTLAQPERSWVLSVCDLHAVDPEAWPGLELNLYDVVQLVDPSLGQTMEAQITELRLCPYYPDRNEISIQNLSGNLGKTGAASLLNRTQKSLYGDLVLTVDQVKKDLVDTGGVAVNAEKIAQAAQAAANNAQNTADNAQSAADSAQSAADNAQNTADSAQTAADNAQNTADSAQSAADNAQSAAESAQDMARKIANGTYTGGTFIDGSKIYSPQILAQEVSVVHTASTGGFPALRFYPKTGDAMLSLNASGTSMGGYSACVSSTQDLVLKSDCAVVVQPGSDQGASGYSGLAVEGNTAVYGNLMVSGDLQCGNVLLERRKHYHPDDGATVDNAATEFSFDYNTAGSGAAGPILSVATLSGGYKMQLSGAYDNGNVFAIRTRNGDTGIEAWNPWRRLLHSGNVSDYITSQGTSGIWRYRVYNSGVKECWGVVTTSVTGQGSWGYGYLGYTAYQSFPFTFARIPSVNVSVGGAVGLWASLGTVSTTQVESHIMGFQSLSGKSVPIYIHAIG